MLCRLAVLRPVRVVRMLSEKRGIDNQSNVEPKRAKSGQSKPITDFFKKSSTTTVKIQEKTDNTKAEVVREDEETVQEVKVSSDFKAQFVSSLTEEQRELLDLEITTMEDSWFQALSGEFLKPYFLTLKRFLKAQYAAKQTIFPPQNDIYSWSRLTPLNNVKAIILGQDPYHNFNQAHGLAFSVKAPTPPPPSLKNMYKALKIDYPEFVIPTGSGSGDLTKWADRGVLLLNACLTVKAHEANSHAKKGWEQFTEVVLRKAIENERKIVLLLWGSPAQKRITGMKLNPAKIHVLKAVHPSPLSAHRGYFECHHYVKSNEWLIANGEEPTDWALKEGNVIDYHKK